MRMCQSAGVQWWDEAGQPAFRASIHRHREYREECEIFRLPSPGARVGMGSLWAALRHLRRPLKRGWCIRTMQQVINNEEKITVLFLNNAVHDCSSYTIRIMCYKKKILPCLLDFFFFSFRCKTTDLIPVQPGIWQCCVMLMMINVEKIKKKQLEWRWKERWCRLIWWWILLPPPSH